MQAKAENRNQFVDIMRGIAMLLVVLGHTMTGCSVDSQKSFLFNIIWSLQMPLFILISGYVTKYKAHIHNHIYWNAITLDCKRKFRDFRRSHRAVARLSDLICTEHQLSVVQNPKRGGSAYNKWHGFKGKPSYREILRIAIDEALE